MSGLAPCHIHILLEVYAISEENWHYARGKAFEHLVEYGYVKSEELFPKQTGEWSLTAKGECYVAALLAVNRPTNYWTVEQEVGA